MVAQASRMRQEPAGNKPDPPTSDVAIPGSVEMIKWKVRWEKHNKKSKEGVTDQSTDL